jgi:hypothetical protein
MYFSDHPPAHFHARYAKYDVQVAIDDGAILTGHLPRRAGALVREWAALHRQELLENWERARSEQPLVTIDPLP